MMKAAKEGPTNNGLREERALLKQRAASIREARKAIEAHDAAMKRQREAEQKLKEATRRYAVAHGLWGFTPTMLRAALARMEQEQAA